MTLRVRRTNLADTDLDSIWLYMAADNVAAAEREMARIVAAEQRLAAFPHLGQARPDIHPDLRGWVVGPYVLLYRVGPDTITIVRILHGARDLPQAFED